MKHTPADRRLAAVAVLAAAVFLTPAAFAQAPAEADAQAVDLRPKFVEGQVSRFEVWTLRNRRAAMQIGERALESTDRLEVTGLINWTVDQVNDDGSATCTMTIDWLATTMSVTPPNGEEISQSNDSRQGSGDNEAMHRMLQAMAGAPIKVEVRADGSVESVAGVDAIQQAAGEDVPAPDEMDFIESASDLATLPGALAQTTLDTTWRHELTTNHQAGKITVPMQYRLASVEQIAGIRVATAVGEAELQFEPDRDKLPEQGNANVEMTNGKATAQVMFDLTRGEAVGRNSVQQYTIESTADVRGTALRQTISETVQSQVLRVSEE